MLSVNSLSGGKTSSFLAAHFPADLDVFALVCIDNYNAGRRIDPLIRQLVNDKLAKYCSHRPEFSATAEDPAILKTMLDLEQHIGREIIWLRGVGFHEAALMKGMLPGKQHRFCTTMLKIDPIFEFLFNHHSLPVKMRIGYRADEAHRVNQFRDTYLMAIHCELGNGRSKRNWNSLHQDFFTGHTPQFRTRWQEVPFRVGEFPLVEHGVVQQDVQRYWRDKSIVFPADSNCQFCFWKHPMQIRENFSAFPEIIYSAAIMEDMAGNTFHHLHSLLEISKFAPQLDLFQMKGYGCQAGFCTD